ncbi:MAG: hypothetical protein PHO70_00915 [Candidatus Omnitrophica bacterium]|nr:hypothetical protein [Candidatus Omnitrophota bacterium]
MNVSLMDTRKIIFEGNIKEAVLPGEDGELTVLDFHQPFLCRLRSGFVTLRLDPLKENRIMIKYGVAKMSRNDLTILVEEYA